MDFVHGSNKEILELQKQYREGKITVDDLSTEQLIELMSLYDKQIEELKLSNEYRKKRLLKYRENMKQVNN